MAVVSISRIQVRRGRKNQGSGLPQLASGEIGWAIDSQELFIGNGSVSEGAPSVGNTKILTESDNVLDFIGDYEYKQNNAYIQTGPSIGSPVTRSILDRLDDRVSTKSFGASGDGTIQTAELQRAIDQLYINPVNVNNKQSRVVLYIEAGEYVIDNTIYIPPYATIRGAGIEKTVIRMIGPGPAFRTVSSLSTPGSYIDYTPSLSVENQARNIELSDMSLILNTNQGLDISSCRDSIFENIKITGNWESNDSITQSNYSILLRATNTITSSNNNIFSNIRTHGTSYAVYSDYDIIGNAWYDCIFNTHAIGVGFGDNTVLGSIGQTVGPCKNVVKDCSFDNIDQEAIKITNGTKNRSQSNKFYSVGNNGGTEQQNDYAVIRFTNNGNITINDWFQRTDLLMYNQAYFFGVPYNSEVLAPNIYENDFTHSISLGQISGAEPEKIFKLPANHNAIYEIDYVYKSEVLNATRSGTLTVYVDRSSVNSSQIVDDYTFIGNQSNSENLLFSVRNYDDNGDNKIDTTGVMVLNYTNNDNAEIFFKVKTKVNYDI